MKCSAAVTALLCAATLVGCPTHGKHDDTTMPLLVVREVQAEKLIRHDVEWKGPLWRRAASFDAQGPTAVLRFDERRE